MAKLAGGQVGKKDYPSDDSMILDPESSDGPLYEAE
jgi:hypothetical protein